MPLTEPMESFWPVKLIIKKSQLDDEPEIIFKDEIMYALGNIIQNAIFSKIRKTRFRDTQ